MASVKKTLFLPYTAEQMYSLVNAIEAYPEFLPWCEATEVHLREPTKVNATLHLAKGPIKHSITTENTMQPNQSIAMQYIAGPFRRCVGSWQFIPDLENQKRCQIIFTMDYQFVNRFVAIAIEPVFAPIANTLIDSFHARAQQIYGN